MTRFSSTRSHAEQVGRSELCVVHEHFESTLLMAGVLACMDLIARQEYKLDLKRSVAETFTSTLAYRPFDTV